MNFKHFHDPVRGAGAKEWVAGNQAADVIGMEAIDVLGRGDRLQNPAFVDMLRQGKLYQNAVDAAVFVQLVDKGQQLGLARSRRGSLCSSE